MEGRRLCQLLFLAALRALTSGTPPLVCICVFCLYIFCCQWLCGNTQHHLSGQCLVGCDRCLCAPWRYVSGFWNGLALPDLASLGDGHWPYVCRSQGRHVCRQHPEAHSFLHGAPACTLHLLPRNATAELPCLLRFWLLCIPLPANCFPGCPGSPPPLPGGGAPTPTNCSGSLNNTVRA